MIIFNRLGSFGRLGNQLFQVVATCSHSKRCDIPAMFNKWEYAHYFVNRVNDKLDSEVMYVNGVEHDLICHFQFDHKPIPEGRNQCLLGYFQSDKYFEPGMVEYLFKPTAELMSTVRQAGGSLIHRTNPVAVHVRRGDYLEKPEYHPPQPIEYYKKGMEWVEKMAGKCTFLVFSDDPEWCRLHFTNENTEIVNKSSDIVDLFLMAQCKHHIISNSSFSWWGAYLRRLFEDPAGQIVIAPKIWAGPEWVKNEPQSHFQDIYCKDWIIL